MRKQDNNAEHIILQKGTFLRSSVWRLIRLLVYFAVIGSVGAEVDTGSNSTEVLIAVIITFFITQWVLNLIWRNKMFQWIYKFPYSKETYSLLRNSGVTGEK